MKYAFFFTLWIFLGIGCTRETSFSSAPPSNSIKNATQNDRQDVQALSVYQMPTKWITQDKRAVQLADFKGKVMVVAMVYTTCTFSCPRLVADMKRLEAALPESQKKKVHLVLVSIDPEHDTPEVLAQFAKERKMNPDQWTLLRGTKGEVQEMAAILGFKYKKVTPVDFSHSNLLSVFDANGRLAYQQEGIAADQTEMLQKIAALTETI